MSGKLNRPEIIPGEHAEETVRQYVRDQVAALTAGEIETVHDQIENEHDRWEEILQDRSLCNYGEAALVTRLSKESGVEEDRVVELLEEQWQWEWENFEDDEEDEDDSDVETVAEELAAERAEERRAEREAEIEAEREAEIEAEREALAEELTAERRAELEAEREAERQAEREADAS